MADPYQISTLSSNTISRQLYSVDELSTTVPVLFEDGSALVPNATLMGGTALTGYTLGVCGRYNGQPAFAMCGHGLAKGDKIKYAENNSVIGTVSEQCYENDKYGDYAIVSITDSSLQEPIWLEIRLTPEVKLKLLELSIARYWSGYNKYGKMVDMHMELFLQAILLGIQAEILMVSMG